MGNGNIFLFHFIFEFYFTYSVRSIYIIILSLLLLHCSVQNCEDQLHLPDDVTVNTKEIKCLLHSICHKTNLEKKNLISSLLIWYFRLTSYSSGSGLRRDVQNGWNWIHIQSINPVSHVNTHLPLQNSILCPPFN